MTQQKARSEVVFQPEIDGKVPSTRKYPESRGKSQAAPASSPPKTVLASYSALRQKSCFLLTSLITALSLFLQACQISKLGNSGAWAFVQRTICKESASWAESSRLWQCVIVLCFSRRNANCKQSLSKALDSSRESHHQVPWLGSWIF